MSDIQRKVVHVCAEWLVARENKKMNPRDVEATRGFDEGVISFVAPTGVDPVTSRFSVVRSTN